MSRYDCPQYLTTWKRTGKFPDIHDAMFRLVTSEVIPDIGVVLDLGSSTGLLTRRLREAGYQVVSIEASRAAIDAGNKVGTYGDTPPVSWKLAPDQMSSLAWWLGLHKVKAVVARRVLPELDDHGIDPAMVSQALIDGGVRHLFLEGRQPRAGAKHRLGALEREIDGLGEHWRVETAIGADLAYLVRS